MTHQRRLMVVAGGPWQVPLVQKAKAMGCFVVNTNLHAASPAFAFADVSVVADVLDQERQLSIAREHQVEAVVTDQSDIAVPTVAYLCEQLGLRGIGMDKAALFTNKHQMRQFVRAHGDPCPDFELFTDAGAAAAWATRIGDPVVLKPVASQASRGVFKGEGSADVRRLFPLSAALSTSGEVIVEQFISGTELTVEGFAHGGTHETLAISRKRHLPHNPMVACELRYAPDDADMNYEALRRQHDRLVKAMGLPFGITHAEYLHRDGAFYLVEVAARGGGTKISSLIVPAVSGAPVNEWLIESALGVRKPPSPRSAEVMPYAMLSFFDFKPGIPKAVHGVDQVRGLPGILDVGMNVEPGRAIHPPTDDAARHGYFIAAARSRQQLDETAAAARHSISLDYV